MPARIVFTPEQKQLWLANYPTCSIEELAVLMGVHRNTLWRRQAELAAEFSVKLRRYPHEMGRGAGTPSSVDTKRAVSLRAEGWSWRRIARSMGCTHTTVARHLREAVRAARRAELMAKLDRENARFWRRAGP